MTALSPICEPGAVVVVRFRMTNQVVGKPRPAIVLTDSNYHNSRSDTIMVPLSTQAGGYYGDTLIDELKGTGLNQQTYAKAVIQTIEQRQVRKRIGTLSDDNFNSLKASLITVLGL